MPETGIENMKALNPGDTIGICAPSAMFDTQKFDSGIAVLSDMGFKTIVPDEIYSTKRYLAGDDPLRARVLESLFSDSQIDAVLCARGGFGAMRMLSQINWQVIKNNPKPVIGFSDNTALLLTVFEKTGQPVIHGPTLLSLSNAEGRTRTSFLQAITGEQKTIHAPGAKALCTGRCEGLLMGGNLATISHLVGTPYQPVFKERILFLEDIGEPAYKIDRMLTQLKMAGVLDDVKGLITGEFIDSANGEYIDEILVETFQDSDIPILTRLKAGHGSINHSLVMGKRVVLDTSPPGLFWI